MQTNYADSTVGEIKMCLREVIMTTNEDNIENTVDFFYSLLTEQGVTI